MKFNFFLGTLLVCIVFSNLTSGLNSGAFRSRENKGIKRGKGFSKNYISQKNTKNKSSSLTPELPNNLLQHENRNKNKEKHNKGAIENISFNDLRYSGFKSPDDKQLVNKNLSIDDDEGKFQ